MFRTITTTFCLAAAALSFGAQDQADRCKPAGKVIKRFAGDLIPFKLRALPKGDNSVSVECTYDYMGRRATKKVTENGTVTLHQRYLYRGYLQIAVCDLLRSNEPCLWLITWDPTQEIATRPLAIQKDGTWYTFYKIS